MKKLAALLALAGLVGTMPVTAAPITPLRLPDGRTVTVSASGIAQVWSADRRTVTYRRLTPSLLGAQRVRVAGFAMPSTTELLNQLRRSPATAYPKDEVIVQFRAGIGTSNNRVDVPRTALSSVRSGQTTPAYTNDTQVNRVLARLGADRLQRVTGTAYRVHITGASVRAAVAELLKSPSVSYASPNWFVSTMLAPGIPIPQEAAAPLTSSPAAVQTHHVPTNYAVAASVQSLLNAPGVNAIGAYDEISQRFHELPGQGEIVTNVSIGDLDDASALGSGGRKGGGGGGDPCSGAVSVNGPTTVLIGGQRYIDWPSMPLIPTYVADVNGGLSGSAEVCNTPDQSLGEIGLDFSVMAPLPHDLQRPGAIGSGFTDLLGIAPGASYRLVVPANETPTIADIDTTLLAAALQNPRPNVITASLGFAFDQNGFPGRYLEEDPLTNAIVNSIVRQYGIVVCIAANDGLRPFTNAAIGPSGGSAETNVMQPGGTPTNLNDISFSTAPSSVFDSGAIDAGGTTLDDIFAAPPQDPRNAVLAAQQAFPTTRYDGSTLFSSGFGARVNLSAPADNIPALQHHNGGAANAVDVFLEGGTSASAPETAAAAAVALQVARLTGRPFHDAPSVRSFLSETGSVVPNAPQSDQALHVGGQINVTSAVETLLHSAGTVVNPSVARIAIAQRRNFGLFDASFVTNTNPSAIDLRGPVDPQTNEATGDNLLAWITIAPDWEGISSAARFSLHVAGKTGTIASGRWARVLPATILRAAGFPLSAGADRTVHLVYQANDRGHLVSMPLALTFGPSTGTSLGALAPGVETVTRGDRIAIPYDLTGVRNVSHQQIIISEPGRINPDTGFSFRPAYIAPITGLKGTAYVPIRALQGDGIYGIVLGLRTNPDGSIDVSDFAYTHVLNVENNTHPSAPLLSVSGSQPAHMIEIPNGGTFSVSWDVSAIRGATGALLEISAAAPNAFFDYNTFNNPGGSIRDNNGVDFGSVYAASVSGARGSITLTGKTAKLVPTMNHVVRVIPLDGAMPVGEASDVSTVLMDGVLPADGGFLTNGFAIDGGDEGLLTSSHITADNTFISSVETFKQSTDAVSVDSSASTNLFFTTGSGLWSGGTGILGTEDLTIPGSPPSASNYHLINAASNSIGAQWQPPVLNDGVSRIVQTAPNATNDIALALTGDPIGSATTPYQVLTSDLSNNTFGAAYNISAALPPGTNAFALGVAQDTSTQRALVSLANFTNQCGNPAIASVDLKTGKINVFNGIGQGFPLDPVIDSTTHTLAYQTDCDQGLNIIDLATHARATTTVAGTNGLYNAIDATHHFIAVQAVGANDGQNNNAMSPVLIYDEHGNLIKTLERFNFFITGLAVNANYLQLNPTTRTGFIFGPLGAELEPFSY